MPDTYTSQFSGEEIDSALRAAQMISGASTLAELRKKLEIRGDTIPVSAEDSTLISEALKKIPTTSGGGINPNLLDNWFFGRPVNQRGQTEYTAAGYTVDRWKFSNNNGKIVLDDTGIMFTGIYDYAELNQLYEFPENIRGKQYTASVLIDSFDGEGNFFLVVQNQNVWASTQLSKGLNHFTDTFWSDSTTLRFFIQSQSVNLSNPPKIHILAAKLELGSTQTLAHQENGVWILNEIPDFGEQLRRCQRYARAYKRLLGQTFLPLGAYRSDRKAVSFVLPTSSFRAVPTVSALDDIFQLFDGANVYGITSLAVTDYSDGLVTIYVYTSQSFEDGKVLWLFSNNGTLLLSADL